MATIYSIIFNGAQDDYTNASVFRAVNGATPVLVSAATITTYGTGGDYADQILASAAVGNVNDGNIQILVQTSNTNPIGLFRPNQSWPNGAVFMGDIPITGVTGVWRVMGSTSTARICLAPSPNVNFQDLFIDASNATYGFQNHGGNTFTRVIMPEGDSLPLSNTSTTYDFSILNTLTLSASSVAGSITTNNCTVIGRMIVRGNNLWKALNCNSIATNWYLGQPIDAGAVSEINFCYIRENAPANEFGPNSSDNTIGVDTTADMVDFANNDFRILSTSPLATAGENGTFVGAFLQASAPTGNTISVSSTMPSMSSSLSIDYTIPDSSASISSIMPSMTSALSINYSIPGNSASITSVMPSMQSSLTVTQSAPQFNASVISTMPSMVSALSITNLPPGNNLSISSIMPSMASALSVSKTNPQYSASINSVMPSMISALSLSVDNPGYDASINSVMPSMTSSLVLTTSEPVTLDLTISSTMPSMTSSLRLVNGEISEIGDITLSYVNDFISVEYTQSTTTINYEE